MRYSLLVLIRLWYITFLFISISIPILFFFNYETRIIYFHFYFFIINNFFKRDLNFKINKKKNNKFITNKLGKFFLNYNYLLRKGHKYFGKIKKSIIKLRYYRIIDKLNKSIVFYIRVYCFN